MGLQAHGGKQTTDKAPRVSPTLQDLTAITIVPNPNIVTKFYVDITVIVRFEII